MPASASVTLEKYDPRFLTADEWLDLFDAYMFVTRQGPDPRERIALLLLHLPNLLYSKVRRELKLPSVKDMPLDKALAVYHEIVAMIRANDARNPRLVV